MNYPKNKLSKKGAVDPPLILAMLLSIALIIILLISIYNFAMSGAARGRAEYIARDLGSLIDVAEAAPEKLEASYKVPISTDGYPKAGSILLDGKRDRVCVSPYSEDEMFDHFFSASRVGFSGMANAARKEQKDIACYSTAAFIEYAEPPNCHTDREYLDTNELKAEYAGYVKYLGNIGLGMSNLLSGSGMPLIPSCDYDKLTKYQGGIISEKDTCYSCPNYFISHPKKLSTQQNKIYDMITAITGVDTSFLDFTSNSNILPRDEYYYMAFPSKVDVKKEAGGKLTIVHAE